MLPLRSPIQTSKTSNPFDEKIFTTYQDEYNLNKTHGNLVKHYGNSAFLARSHSIQSSAKPFIAPSYNNITSNAYIANRFSDKYSNNYLSSVDNPLRRSVDSAPVKTKLDHLYNVKIFPVASINKASEYQQEFFHNRLNDHFASSKPLKTDTTNLKDTLALLMELADFLRNKSFHISNRSLFQTDEYGVNDLENFGQRFTNLMFTMKELIRSYDELKQSATELKKMSKNFVYAQNIIDRNIWDRKLKPNFERVDYKDLEYSLHHDKMAFDEQNEAADKALKECHLILSSIEKLILESLNSLFEEAKIIFMKKLNPKDYETSYLRDSNGYIRKDAKIQMNVKDWLNLADQSCQIVEQFTHNANQKSKYIDDLISTIALEVSNQWIATHDKGIDQVEQGLKTQGKLITSQYDLNQEIYQLNKSILDTKQKMGTCKMFNEVYLTQVNTPLLRVDPYLDENRKRQSEYSNSVWENKTELEINLKEMIQYRKELVDKQQRSATNIKSNHDGLNYDIRTIVNPRRNAVAVQPSIDLVRKSISIFE